MFKVGDKVKISNEATYSDQTSNPRNMKGVVIEHKGTPLVKGVFCYRVMWENGFTNGYRFEELSPWKVFKGNL